MQHLTTALSSFKNSKMSRKCPFLNTENFVQDESTIRLSGCNCMKWINFFLLIHECNTRKYLDSTFDS